MDKNQKQRNLRVIIVVISFLCASFVFSLSGCDRVTRSESNKEIKEVHLGVFADYPTATSLDKMEEMADYIVVGHYTGDYSIWNMARKESNWTIEDEENHTEGRLYDFVVEEVIKGQIDASLIKVNQKYSEVMHHTIDNAVVNEQGIILKPATESKDYSFIVKDPLFIEPEKDKKYVLFLLYTELVDNYYAAVEPFTIDVSEESVNLITNMKDGFIEGDPIITEDVRFQVSFGIGEFSDNITGINTAELLEMLRNKQK